VKRGFKQWAEVQSIKYRQALGLRVDARLPAARLAEHLEVTVVTANEIPGVTPDILDRLLHRDKESWSAVTLPANDCTLVIYNPSHSLARQESNLMHELAHIICEHDPESVVQLHGLYFPLRTYDAEQEEEAAWLGGCLQIPRDGLWRAVCRGTGTAQIAQHFGASVSLVQFRRQVTGVDRQFQRFRS
jgi:Zn-dependent peptidase ImmA (M78 family)